MNADANLGQAVAHHREGRFEQAERIYKAVLASQPANPDALHLYGVLRMQCGHPAEAVDLIGRAVTARPDDPSFHSNLGTARMEAGDLDGAVQSLQKALSIAPDHPDASFNLGNALMQMGRMAEAETVLQDVLKRMPGHPVALNALGLAAAHDGRTDQARERFTAAIAAAPDFPDAHANLGQLLIRTGAFEEAVPRLKKAIELHPDHAQALCALGAALTETGDFADAKCHLDEALRIAPNMAETHLNLGNWHRRQYAFEAAISSYRDALAIAPEDTGAHNNLANALNSINRRDEARRHIDRAMALLPNDPATLTNLAQIQKGDGDMAQAIETFDRALAAEPAFRDARFGRSVCALLLGRFSEGWRDYRARESLVGARHSFESEPLPQDLTGKRVLIRRDQGLGDELFFLRFIPALKARGAKVVYEPDPRLRDMLERARIVDDWLASGAAAQRFDHEIAVCDLPWLLGMADGTAPPPTIELSPLPDLTETLSKLIDGIRPSPRIALTWRGGVKGQDRGLYKEVPLDQFGAALKGIDATFIAVQRNPARDEIAELSTILDRPVHDMTGYNDDLEAMLALMPLFDAYAGVSNTNVHLREACGRPSHVLVPNPPEFRWMATGPASPWFPGTGVYRQATDGSWDDALVRLTANLTESAGA